VSRRHLDKYSGAESAKTAPLGRTHFEEDANVEPNLVSKFDKVSLWFMDRIPCNIS
jgi:hypothetical protein